VDRQLADYIADYILEEIRKGNHPSGYTVLDAIAAYEGGAR